MIVKKMGDILALSVLFAGAVAAQTFTADNVEPSFIYGNEPFDKNTWAKTEKIDSDTADIKKITRTYTSADKALKLSISITEYKKFNVVYWIPTLENISALPTQAIKNFRSMNWQAKSEHQNIMLRYYNGSRPSSADFVENTKQIGYWIERKFKLENLSGRCSESYLPSFAVDFDARNGLLGGIGWAGSWTLYIQNYNAQINKGMMAAQFRNDAAVKDANGKFILDIGMPETNFSLAPAQKVDMPSIFIANRKNMAIEDAQNLHRRFMIKHCSPLGADGKLIKTPYSLLLHGCIPETRALNLIKFLKKHAMPFDQIWLDAGWYGPDIERPESLYQFDWWNFTGDWRVNKKVYPNGLRVLSSAARDSGYKTMLWIEMERAGSKAQILKSHPEYFNNCNASNLINLQNKDAYDWICKAVESVLSEEKIDNLRIDFNIRPAANWKRLQTPQTVGLPEIQYVNALYRLLEKYRAAAGNKRFIDNCASGGMRLNFEMAKVSIPLWRSDVQCFDVDDYDTGNQNQVFYLSQWMPLNAGGVFDIYDGNDYHWLSGVASGLSLTLNSEADATERSDENFKKFKTSLNKLRRISELFYYDMYALFPNPEKQRNFFGYQLDCPEEGRGCFLVLNRKFCDKTRAEFTLRKIDPNAEYELEDWNSKTRKMSGKDMRNFAVDLPTPKSFAVYFYKKLK